MGGLAATVFSCAKSVQDVTRLALPVTRIAFRIGLYAGTVSDSIVGRRVEETPRNPWSICFKGLSLTDAQNLLRQVNKSIAERVEEVPISRRCYITAIGQSSITISGSPDALEYLLSSAKEHLQGKSKLRLPVYAAYHVPRLYNNIDLEWLLCGGDEQTKIVLQNALACKSQLCASTGSAFKLQTASELLKAVISDILVNPLRWDKIVASAALLAQESATELVSISSIGAPGACGSLASALRASFPDMKILESNGLSANILQNETKNREPIQEPLAIVGMSGRFPGAADHEALWELLNKGLDLHKEIPEDRFDKTLAVDPTGKKNNTSWTPYGCFVDNPGLFDPAFFHISPREALQTDPMQRLSLVTAYEALEMAGYTPNRTLSTRRERIGTFYGQASDDYREVNSSQKIDTYYITGGIRAFGPGRINYYFKFSGPSFNIDTACSSSFAAIQLACTSIWAGDCDTAVAGGTSILTNSDLFAGLSRGQFLSTTGSCKTFDNGADGYCRADAVASIVIKRLSDAQKDNDRILATIAAMRTNHSAEAISITHPHAKTQMKLYRQILSDAGIHPHDINLVEMHGTGTQAGDSIEMESVSEVFANAENPRVASNPLFVGSIKSNLGHAESASGVTALIKSIMMLQKKTIPPHVGIKGTINKKFPDLNVRNIKIAFKTTSIENNGKPLSMMVNNFSAAGGNTAMILNAYSDPFQPSAGLAVTRQVITLSGHTFTALKNNVSRLLAFLQEQPDIDPRHLSYTTTARRIHYKFRMTLVGKSVADFKSGLVQWLQGADEQISKTVPKKLVIIFTGQGAVYTDIGRRIFQTWAQARSELESLDKIVKENSFPSIMDFLYANEDNKMELSPTQSQLGVLCVQITLYRLWVALGINPSAVIGHSLGEYAAMVAAGVLSAADAIYLVGHRASLLENHCKKGSHCMLVIKSSEAAINEFTKACNIGFEIACLNAKDQTVVSGTTTQIDALVDICQNNKVQTTKLATPYAFHSSQIDSILDAFGRIAERVVYKKSSVTYLSALYGRPLEKADTIDASYLCNHARQSVKFVNCLDTALTGKILDQNTAFLEVGLHPLCSPMLRSAMGTQCMITSTMENKQDLKDTIASTASKLHGIGVDLDWNQYQQLFNTEPRLLHLPAYAFDNKDYWIMYKNNWCLTKDSVPMARIEKEEDIPPTLISSSVHKMIDSDFKGTKPFAIFETKLAQKELHDVLIGHRVNGACLCSSSVYADISVTIADVLQKHMAIKVNGISVSSMEVTAPINIRPDRTTETRTLRLHASFNKTLTQLTLEFIIYDGSLDNQTKVARCIIQYGDTEQWKADWNRINYLLIERIDHVCAKANRGEANKLLKPMAYQLFARLLDYSTRFQNMEVVSFDCPAYEAVAKVRLSKQEAGENFKISPYWIDSLTHLAGLVMNGNDQEEPSNVYISHGWEDMRFATLPQGDQDYTCYVKMQPIDPKVYAGDVWILHNNMIVGVCKGLKFQRIPRKILNIMLPPVTKTPATQPTTKATATATATATTLNKRAPRSVEIQAAVQKLANTTKQRKQNPTPTEGSTIKKIIADEVGVSNLDEDATLNELGIDSLLTLSIVDRIREETSIKTSPALFLECVTVKDVLEQLGGDEAELSSSSSSGYSSPLSETPDRLKTGVTTPGLDTSHTSVSHTPSSEFDGSDAVRTIIAEEFGFNPEEMSDDSDLIAQGMDSLMMLSIQSRLQEQFNRHIAPGFLTDHSTVREIREELCGYETPSQSRSVPQAILASKSLLIHDPPSRDRRHTLFLFPDGSGRAASYADIPNPGTSVRTIALDSPFLDDPSKFNITMEECVSIYLAEVRRQQPRGPYSLGGWSIGGVYAFEACRQLQKMGEKVEQLILIDSPCPTTLEPMPKALVEYLEKIGTFGPPQKQTSPTSRYQVARQQLAAHFEGSVRCLETYHATPLANTNNLVTHLFEASHGVYHAPEKAQLPPPDAELEDSSCAQWILYDREQGAAVRDWSALLGDVKIKETRLEGNHFSIMRKPNVAGLGGAIKQALR